MKSSFPFRLYSSSLFSFLSDFTFGIFKGSHISICIFQTTILTFYNQCLLFRLFPSRTFPVLNPRWHFLFGIFDTNRRLTCFTHLQESSRKIFSQSLLQQAIFLGYIIQLFFVHPDYIFKILVIISHDCNS